MPNQLSVQETFKQKIAENLKNQFMELLPPELLDELTKAAWDELINGSPSKRCSRDYNPFNDPDTLKGMIMLELKAQAKEKMVEVLRQPEWQMLWDGDSGSYVSEALNEIIANNTDAFVRSMFKNVVGSFMQGALNNLRNGY